MTKMKHKIISVHAIHLGIKHIVKQISYLSCVEQKIVLQYINKSVKDIKTTISLNSGKFKRKQSLISKCMAKCKNSDGLYKFVIRRKEYGSISPILWKSDIKESDFITNSSDVEDEMNHNSINSSHAELKSQPEQILDRSENMTVLSTFQLRCCLCSSTFGNYLSLSSHLFDHNGSPVSCLRCKKLFNNLSTFKIHLNTDCSNCVNMSKEKLLSYLSNAIQTYGQKYLKGFYCCYCGHRFSKVFNLKRHLNTVCKNNDNDHIYRCDICPKKFNDEVSYSQHLQQRSHYKCLNCDLYFPTTKLLKSHSRTHTKSQKNKYICKLCNMNFPKRSVFREHNRKHKNDNQLNPIEESWRVWCNICNISFHDTSTLKRHCTRKSHIAKLTDDKESLNMRTFMCVKCDRAFMTKDALSTHCSRIHCNKTLVKCDKCPYKTDLKFQMKRHILTHDTDVNKRNIFCDKCPSRFTTSSALKEHLKSVHSEERSYSCNICPKSFKLSKLLNRHKSIHNPSLPFVCTHCTVGFKRKSHLKRHIDTRHKELASKQSNVENKEYGIQDCVEQTSKLLPMQSLAANDKAVEESVISERVFSLIDAQSGELVTLSATELSKNAVINISSGELLNEVNISDMWNHPNQSYNLDPILQNGVIGQPEFIMPQDRNEIPHMDKIVDTVNDKNAIQFYIVPPSEMEALQTDGELTYFYV